MAQATKTTRITIHLTLNEPEAVWLKAVLQNPVHGQSIDEEHPDSARTRRAIWEAIASQGIV